MNPENKNIDDTYAAALEDLEKLRSFSGSPGEFWPRFIKTCSFLIAAELGLLMVKGDADEGWKNLCAWPSGRQDVVVPPDMSAAVHRIAEDAASQGAAWEQMKKAAIFGIRLDIAEKGHAGIAVFMGGRNLSRDPEKTILKLKLAADIPHLYQIQRETDKARNDVVGFVETLDLMVLLNAENRYLAAAMMLCNELSFRFKCTRVSIGWLKRGYVRVQAISHMEKFEKKMDAVQVMEAAMEEAFDQDEEIVYPKNGQHYSIVKDHEAFSRDQGVKYIVSLPIRRKGEGIGVLTCEREDSPFLEKEVHLLRMICDQAAYRLADLKKSDRWFGAKFAAFAKDGIGRFLGVKHTFAKCVGLLIFALLAFLLFGTWEYRLEAPFILKTDDLAYIPAPFDGYIKNVHVRVGDRVRQHDLLLELDDRELLLEESSAIADRTRYAREAKKAGAKYDLAEMKIAHALKIQAEAKLDLIRYHLANSGLRAPFAGIVVEGELKELLGAPVRKGDVLFKVAKIENLYAVLDLDEKDVHEASVDQIGEIAFISRPELKYPIKIQFIEPVAVTKQDGNIFTVHCAFSEDIQPWWRPGMSGIAKINVGKRNILWIFTHRTVDFLRLLLWW